MKNVIVSKDSMINFINTRDSEMVMHYIGRALVALFNRQVEDEKKTNNTHNTNYLGFSKSDARQGSISAKSYIKNGKLEDWQVSLWINEKFRGNPRIVKYSRQLNEIAAEKAARKARG